MTNSQKIQAIREACIAANPDFNGRVTLAGVLLAMSQAAGHIYTTANAWKLIDQWNLRQDDLSLQSEETIDCIHQLLTNV